MLRQPILSPGAAVPVRLPGYLTGPVARTDVALVIPRAVRPRQERSYAWLGPTSTQDLAGFGLNCDAMAFLNNPVEG